MRIYLIYMRGDENPSPRSYRRSCSSCFTVQSFTHSQFNSSRSFTMARPTNTAATVQLTGAAKAAATRQAKADAAKAEQLRAARAEVRAKRKAERDAAAAAAAHAQAHQPEAAAASMEDFIADFEMPSWKRVTVGIILGLTGAGFVGYGIGMIMAYALAGIATLTASSALAFALSALVWVLGIYASWKIGGWVGGKIFASVVLPDGLASRSYQSLADAVGGAKDRVSGVFSSSSTVQRAQQFTGAHMAGAKGGAA